MTTDGPVWLSWTPAERVFYTMCAALIVLILVLGFTGTINMDDLSPIETVPPETIYRPGPHAP
jgi:hypothetical protein